MSITKVRLTIDSNLKDEQERAKLAELHQFVVSHIMSLEFQEGVKVTMEYGSQAESGQEDLDEADGQEWGSLSDRQRQIARMLCQHYSIKRIAEELYVSVNTVKKHIQNVKKTLNIEASGADFTYALEQMLQRGKTEGKEHTQIE
ncbi:helix-turn-helix transcriptional regulator [Brevibacillus centrosporus]|uniref:response regulator transcription factor n=1 Tax=Brevibacillus centrosporus TaxID=54910 RepID=UPI000F0A74A0|nr:helix-turn-helix transcriptional regulator [Brevibacillus centrosporus]MEC2130821.1 helix-turn-helix transcriptional regulator [Brevibacillus centrosporus]RNB69154.1 LuxR family transcriptional regulator [Brevibacillus centrosporus]GED31456.1 hypothetical protein BCE02nite_25970 [Brevibacillus centrosporus]